ncbi:cytochrome P450 714C2-like [Arachis stenosperma]|uniref:cytochrome P450 714C2-like n=1 Tax=Arachis stenosperma TaxID=217475 RepID=UPI0025AD49C2|nr:cytochrome P450 714C2-like [Arachis stenosperma]
MSSLAMVLQFDPKFLTSIALVVASVVLFMLYNDLVVKPKRLRSKLSNQGINGPTPSFMIGNIWEIKKAKELITTTPRSPNLEPVDVHDCASLTFPFIETWKQKYGKVFTFSIGNTQILVVNKPEIVRDIITCKSLDLGRPSYEKRTLGPLLGQGIATSNGTKWANQRKILAPELYMEKVKGMMTMIGECATSLVNSWDDIIKENGGSANIKVDEYFREFSGDVISRACFGSNYSKGKQIFSKLEALQEILSKNSLLIWIPGIIKYLPTRNNREAWKLEKDVKNCILEVVRDRKEYANDDNNKFKDLLQMVLEAAKNSNLSEGVIENFIVDNCKTIYVAGYETTAITAAWCLMLLASNQEWQDLVRAEALQICNGKIPDSTMLSKMKQLTMVIHETLRLYSPIPVISREALKDMKFGDLNVPKGVLIWAMPLSSHTDPDIWGSDAYKFKPERFANGVSGACKLPHMYMPFGMGPRVCLGRDLAITELKILLSLILSNFSFSLSPQYIHSPSLKLLVEPQYGVNLLVKKL